eukprot:CAMPEP_0201716418 /NCGR_PEP_ID=MMETSP0593-20130828/2387_1 /ASSEMBLY_ACC=CAM_ASM_000672 /TAXON_ID=267983 /ORGANISM="Skeletonema japonicum, Strain CCMP2506" /LENGTH=312 /DNA_ID=CAMNT_0048206209 /DNA_START=37 /DNA_END=975 /DNA_ORIENTATION=-
MSPPTSEEDKTDPMPAAAAAASEEEKAPTPLRICCYGSSSSRTPAKYTDAAYNLGYHLAKRGHTCVNGAGKEGCMAAMNRGANDGDGAIVGVTHEAFIVDDGGWFEGAHSVFKTKHTILTAKGTDLQERKKLLVEGADGLVVLPGGPGTWDELWEMACARHIGFHALPIVCVNVDGYYENFKSILMRAHEDELLYKLPEEILHFEDSAEAAVKWIESYHASVAMKPEQEQKKVIERKTSMLKRMQSNLSGSTMTVWGRMTSFFGDDICDDDDKGASGGRQYRRSASLSSITLFAAGVSVGFLAASKVGVRKM